MKTLALTFTLIAGPALAEPALIEAAQAHASGTTWRFSVTLSHPDSGWDHYADGWEVLDGAGNQLGYRTLAHPHVNEQPFTRSLSGIDIPAGTRTVYVRAHCLVDGWSSQIFEVTLNK